MSRVMRSLVVFVTFLFVACAPAASTPTASPTTTPATAAPSAIATPAGAPASSTAPASSVTPIPLPTSAQVAAAGNGVVWMFVANSRLFVSRDKGATWTERTAPQVVNGGVAFIDDRNGWALSAGSAATGCQAQGYDVWRTTDGAQTWQRVFTVGTTSTGCKSDLAFVDATHGYITVSGRDIRPLILRTADGGATWSASAAFPDAPGIPFQPSVTSYTPGPVADFGSLLYTDILTFQGGTPKHLIYRSTDRGATWSYDSPTLQSTRVVFLTSTHWIQIVPRDSRETTDAGKTWSFFPSDYQQAAPIDPQIVFGDANVGYATVRGGIRRTLDGGAHWGAIKTPGT